MTEAERSESTSRQIRGPKSLRGPQRRAKRGEGIIFDVIDEWLAPALARWIANQSTGAQKQDS